MPHPAHNPLLHRPRIRPRAQHLHIMIRLHHEHGAAPKMVAHAYRHVAKVGRDADFDSLRAKGKTHRVDSVVRNSKRHDLDITHAETATGREMLALRQLWSHTLVFEQTAEQTALSITRSAPNRIARSPLPGMMRGCRDEYWHVQLYCQPI